MNLYRMFVRPEGADGEYGATLMEKNGVAMAHEAVSRLDLKPSDRVIEIGFGPGVGIQTLLQAVPQGHVTGVDPSQLMHRRAASRNAEAIRNGRATLVKGTVDELPFPDDSFDAGLAIDNLHFWPDPLIGLVELKRVLKCGAPFLCAFTPVSGGSKHGLAETFVKAGYEDVSVQNIAAGVIVRGTSAKKRCHDI